MKILVPFKRVPEAAAIPGAPENAYVINPFDEIAMEEAIRIRDAHPESQVVAVTVATEAADEQVRAAFARGVDRALRVDEARALDSFAVARILAAVVRAERPDLVLMGKQAIDDDANQVGQMLAGLLGWPQATFVSKIEFTEVASQVRCTRETDRGLEVICVTLPAVITADLRLIEPRYIPLSGLIKARRRTVERTSCAELGVDVRPRTKVLDVFPPPQRGGRILVESVEDLVDRLSRVDKVL